MYTPKFTITNKILKNIGSIEASKEVIDNAPLLPYFEREFREDAMVRTVHYGTHIEGNELNLSEAEKVLLGQQVAARDRDIQEVINYRKVMEFIDQTPKAQIKIDEELVKHLHKLTVEKILVSEQCGVFRKLKSWLKIARPERFLLGRRLRWQCHFKLKIYWSSLITQRTKKCTRC